MTGETAGHPRRRGDAPRTTTQIPHSQLDQQPADDRWLLAVLDQAATWPHVRREESRISVEGAVALVLKDVTDGPPEAFMVGGEFVHGHAGGDYSLHAALPLPLAAAAEESGWAEPHFLVHEGRLPATIVMLYAPRDEQEAGVVLDLVRASYEFACSTTGMTTTPETNPETSPETSPGTTTATRNAS